MGAHKSHLMNNAEIEILKNISKPARAVTLRTGNYRSFLISAPVAEIAKKRK